jgi:hypothetical protein
MALMRGIASRVKRPLAKPALIENHLDDDGCDCGEREPYQDIQNPDQDPRETPLAPLAPPELVELVGLGHVPSAFRQSVSLGLRNSYLSDLSRLIASLVHIAFYCCEPGADKAGECLPLEAVSVHEERLVGAIRAVGKNR